MDLTSEAFTRWTVLTDGGGRRVTCRCSCGVQKQVDRYNLLRSLSQSCGCLGRELRTKHPLADGATFGRWTVLDASNREAVRCRCECGVERDVAGSNLVHGISRSCGCRRNESIAAIGRANRKHAAP